MMIYLDRYERRSDCWYFQRRTPLYWYECDITSPPTGERKLRWPGHEWYEGDFHNAFPTWREFWEQADNYGNLPVRPPAPLGKFIGTLRRGQPAPRVKGSGGPESV